MTHSRYESNIRKWMSTKSLANLNKPHYILRRLVSGGFFVYIKQLQTDKVVNDKKEG